MAGVHSAMASLGFSRPYIGGAELVVSAVSVSATLASYYILFGRRHRKNRKQLQLEIAEARALVSRLETELDSLKEPLEGDGKKKSVRIWMDGDSLFLPPPP